MSGGFGRRQRIGLVLKMEIAFDLYTVCGLGLQEIQADRRSRSSKIGIGDSGGLPCIWPTL